MKTIIKIIQISFLYSLYATPAYAETLFITNQLQVGLHEEKSIDSPIVKIIPSGTSVEIIKQEDQLSFVREPQGASGWVDNSYLVKTKPGSDTTQIKQLERQLENAKRRIQDLQAQTADPDQALANLRAEHDELQQNYKSEKIKNGKLQIELSELRKRIGQDNDNESLYKQIQKLESDKKKLEVELAMALDKKPDNASNGDLTSTGSNVGRLHNDWKKSLLYFFLTLFTGFCIGLYVLDYYNRRKHGGFRV